MTLPSNHPQPAYSSHVPVLLRETIALLDPRPGETVIDCTAGLGGHAAAIAERIGEAGTIVLFDLDPLNLEIATRRMRAIPGGPRVVAFHGSFAEVGAKLGRNAAGAEGELAPASVVLADLGFASPQVDDPARGFSFMRDGPLDMRLNPQAPITAAELVNTLPERELADLIGDYGEEPPAIARRIASKVVQERKREPIQTTARLAEIVRSAMPAAVAASSKIHPATRTFQGLRIAVNDEIGSLERLLGSISRAAAICGRLRDGRGRGDIGGGGDDGAGAGRAWLAPGARVGIISFHSLEDRPVKRMFGELAERGLAEPLTKKPIVASDEEIGANPRSRSAKLRGIRFAKT